MLKLKLTAALLATVFIPFSGFYESALSGCIDSDIEREISYINESENIALTSDDFVIDYVGIYEDTAKHLAAYYSTWIKENTSLDITCDFSELWRPSEYNFETDRIYCDIPRVDIHKLLVWLNKQDSNFFSEYVRRKFKAAPGWIPFYSANLKDWGDFSTWDNSQLSQVLEAFNRFIEGDYPDFYDSFEGTFWDHFSGNYSVSNYMTRLYDPEIGLPDDLDIRWVNSYYLSYLINNDPAGLTDQGIDQIDSFTEQFEPIDEIRKSADGTHDFRRCEITGELSDCVPLAVRFKAKREAV